MCHGLRPKPAEVVGKVLKVRQGGTELDLDLEGGTTVTIITAEETSSVMLRNKARPAARGGRCRFSRGTKTDPASQETPGS